MYEVFTMVTHTLNRGVARKRERDRDRENEKKKNDEPTRKTKIALIQSG